MCSADLVGRNREGTEKLSLLCFQLRCCSVLVVLGAESSNQMMLLFIQDEEAAQRSKAKQWSWRGWLLMVAGSPSTNYFKLPAALIWFLYSAKERD
jgi:hypothetical protein